MDSLLEQEVAMPRQASMKTEKETTEKVWTLIRQTAAALDRNVDAEDMISALAELGARHPKELHAIVRAQRAAP